MIVQEPERVLRTSCDNDSIQEVLLRILIICIYGKITLGLEVFIEMFAAYEERIVILVDVMGFIQIVFDDIRLQHILILLKAKDPLTVYLIHLSVHDHRPEPVHLASCDIDQGRLDDETLVRCEYLLGNSELGLEMEIVSYDLQLCLIDDNGLLGHLADHDRLSQLDQLDGHVDIDDLTIVHRHFIIIVFRLIEKQFCIVGNECRIVAVNICESNLISVIDDRDTSYRFRCGKVPYHSLNPYFVLCFCPVCRKYHQDEGQKQIYLFHSLSDHHLYIQTYLCHNRHKTCLFTDIYTYSQTCVRDDVPALADDEAVTIVCTSRNKIAGACITAPSYLVRGIKNVRPGIMSVERHPEPVFVFRRHRQMRYRQAVTHLDRTCGSGKRKSMMLGKSHLETEVRRHQSPLYKIRRHCHSLGFSFKGSQKKNSGHTHEYLYNPSLAHRLTTHHILRTYKYSKIYYPPPHYQAFS